MAITSPTERDLALRRRRHLIVASTAAGIGGTALLAAVAATTIPGSASPALSASTPGVAASQSPTDGGATDGATRSGDSTPQQNLQAPPAPVDNGGSADAAPSPHAVTGGSGR